jgi:hypothetical protein
MVTGRPTRGRARPSPTTAHTSETPSSGPLMGLAELLLVPRRSDLFVTLDR